MDWGVNVFSFEAFDEPWKPVSTGADGSVADETHWGVWNSDRSSKYSLSCQIRSYEIVACVGIEKGGDLWMVWGIVRSHIDVEVRGEQDCKFAIRLLALDFEIPFVLFLPSPLYCPAMLAWQRLLCISDLICCPRGMFSCKGQRFISMFAHIFELTMETFLTLAPLSLLIFV